VVLGVALILIFVFSSNEFFKLSIVGFNCLFTVGFFFVSNYANESLGTFRKLFPQFIICSVFIFLMMNGIAIILLPSTLLFLEFVLYEAVILAFGWRCLRYLYEDFAKGQEKPRRLGPVSSYPPTQPDHFLSALIIG
jgi:hypothetical protein